MQMLKELYIVKNKMIKKNIYYRKFSENYYLSRLALNQVYGSALVDFISYYFKVFFTFKTILCTQNHRRWFSKVILF